MNILNNKEYEFLKTDKRLGNNLILVGLGGSRAYGTNKPDSDTDIRGIAVRDRNSILLSKDFETVTDNATDTVIYSLDKMFKLLAECNPNCIEMLGLRPQDYLYVAYLGQKVLDNKDLFLSKHCINTFGGYATQQLYRLRQKTLDALSPEEFNEHIAKTIEGMEKHLEESWHIPKGKVVVRPSDDGLRIDCADLRDVSLEDFYGMCNEINNTIREYNKRSTRNEKAIAHEKCQKHAMHLLRLYMMAIDLLEKGEIITYREAEHDLLMSVRNGEFNSPDGLMNADFWKLLDSYEKRFEVAKRNTKLPDHPDYEGIEKLRLTCNHLAMDRKRILYSERAHGNNKFLSALDNEDIEYER